MTYLERALADGHARLLGEGKQQKIIYMAFKQTERFSDPEEKIRAEFWAELIYRYGYNPVRIGIEVVMPDRVPNDRADLVLYRDDERKRVYAVVECKTDEVTDGEFRQAIEQAFGNGGKLRADYVMVVAGRTRRVYDTTHEYPIGERDRNIVADLPREYGKPAEYKFHKGTELDIQPVEQSQLSAAIRKAHDALWGAGKNNPAVAFSEMCKLIFIKISDEKQKRKPGEPYEFQIKTHETPESLARRIHALYEKQRQIDPNVFTDSIRVDNGMLQTVVGHLESLNLSKTELDTKGVAFEQFMDSFFKGSYGQYFTPRPVVQFMVEAMQPTNEYKVLDPACGSGGFLLYALDKVRQEADEYYADPNSRDHYEHWHTFALKNLYGIEISDDIARVAKMNMIIHDDGHTNVIGADALENSEDVLMKLNPGFGNATFDLILTNPPFGGKAITINSTRPYLAQDYELANQYDKNGKEKPRNSQKPEILFLERIWYFLKTGTGRAAVIVPDGILSNSSLQYVREWLLNHFQILGVVSLPITAFNNYGAGVKTSILFFRKRYSDEKPDMDELIFMAISEKIGYDATGRKAENHLPDIIKYYSQFKRIPPLFPEIAIQSPSLTVFRISLQRLIESKRIDPHFHHPSYKEIVSRLIQKSHTTLGNLVTFSTEMWNPKTANQEAFQYIEISGVNIETGEYQIDEIATSEAPSRARMVVRANDILVSTTRPQRGAIMMVIADHDGAIASTGFVIIRAIQEDIVLREYLLYVLRTQTCLQQMLQRSSGGNYPAITQDELAKIIIPLPPLDIQQTIVEELNQRRAEARRLRQEADQLWQTAQANFEQALLGTPEK
jgi:type I restriction enzyme M protein